jgi:ketosteroid isomerase-like protein
VYTEDAEWLVPQAPVVRGRQAIAQAWRGIIGSGGNNLRIEICELQESGDWTYEVGRFEASAPKGTILNSGKYIVIWKRQATREWKTHRDIFNWKRSKQKGKVAGTRNTSPQPRWLDDYALLQWRCHLSTSLG